MHIKQSIFCGLLAIGALTATSGAAVVQITSTTAQGPTVHIGDMVTVTVAASVSGEQDGTDGIFTFDQNFIVASSGSPFEIVSVNRPGVDALYGGSDGTASSTGVDAIYGAYDGESEGIGSPVTLYTVTLEAVGLGSATLSSGPSVTPEGTDILLNESSSPSVGYLIGPTVQVVAVPEPGAMVGMMGMAGCVIGSRKRRVG
ncbi:MAG TPA: PEP-CTERM sorting domain-containing protein [Tepidisphaeraceae bacterium]|jgi:hypothetical protein|nr:PEP-CTERM sorting domain-containing protein [Tepidisphaeraceae bacterium]